MENYNFVGIGKIMFDTKDPASYNIPHLHCLISQVTEHEFETITLEFGLVSSGDTVNASIENMTKIVVTYIKQALSIGKGFKPFIDIVSSCDMEEYWAEYRKMEFSLAEQKKDLGHEIIEKIKDSVRNEIFKQYGIKPSTKFTLVTAA